MRRYYSTTRVVNEAARRIKKYLTVRAGGKLPRSLKAWRLLAERLGIHAGPVHGCPANFTARLFYESALDKWFIEYNPKTSIQRLCIFMCHELFEFVALGEHASLFDDLRTYAYDGGEQPNSLTHQIGKRGEQLCFRK